MVKNSTRENSKTARESLVLGSNYVICDTTGAKVKKLGHKIRRSYLVCVCLANAFCKKFSLVLNQYYEGA